MSRGVFISFEGGEGSGKSTQILRLAESLKSSGFQVVVCREPGGTPLGEAVRDLLLKIRKDPPAALTELLLLESSRSHLVQQVILPALKEGRIVLCDRYADASMAYQWGGRGLASDLVRNLNKTATGGLTPDRTVLLDMDPSEGRRRQGRAGMDTDRMESENLEFHSKVRCAYLSLAKEEPGRFIVVDAAQGIDQLAEEILRQVQPYCLERLTPSGKTFGKTEGGIHHAP
ncbi:MAG: dTMP kinase [Candidatus Eisenbacteria bacterium]|uniref:Thymidylate kinase n=1 Tax=Eiseniibacteriota bacterium TaxID=2212470 RepID=A0A948RR56_UNCEI|nr:dTMP kinase [Candidatus Eisenbacteria bacterium]MBU1947729.1 dTMP kinase [Candidatus Eisenbacteria bacterium]MBU2689465.1 dTMP kinase [Candidatus Eisenbacteria bacterium]